MPRPRNKKMLDEFFTHSAEESNELLAQALNLLTRESVAAPGTPQAAPGRKMPGTQTQEAA